MEKQGKCICSGTIDVWDSKEYNEHIYRDLGICSDCNKDYLLTVDGYKFLSKAEFRRITEGRNQHEREKVLSKEAEEMIRKLEDIRDSFFREVNEILDRKGK